MGLLSSSTQNNMSIFAKLCLLALTVAAADGARARAQCKVEGMCRNDRKRINYVSDDITYVELCNLFAGEEFERCGNKKDEKITATFTDYNGKSSTSNVGAFDPNHFITGK